MEQCVVLGRGFNLSTALEWAPKLKELTYVRAHAYSTADFQHGPVASIEPGAHLLAIAPPGAMSDELWAVLERLRAERNAQLIAIRRSPRSCRRSSSAFTWLVRRESTGRPRAA